MKRRAERYTVDLSEFPDLVVIYLGMTVNTVTGLRTLVGFGPKIDSSVAAKPDGLLAHENFLFSLFPTHLGIASTGATSTRWKISRAPIPIVSGGANFSAIPAVPASGMRPI